MTALRKPGEAVAFGDWKLTQTEHLNMAELHGRQHIEIYLDEHGLECVAESGCDYSGSRERFNVPTDILVSLLRHAGYEVRKP